MLEFNEKHDEYFTAYANAAIQVIKNWDEMTKEDRDKAMKHVEELRERARNEPMVIERR